MRLILSLLMLSVLAVGLACNNAAKPEISKKPDSNKPAASQADSHNHADEAQVARITLEEAKKEFDAGNAVFVDTRDASSYRLAHIKGAIHLPAGDAATRWKEIPRGKKVIAYCS